MIVKLGGVGDAVLATPILAPLSERHPAARLDVACWSAAQPVFLGNPRIGEVFSSPILDAAGFGHLARSLRFRELARLRTFFRGADAVLFLNRICTVGGFLKLLFAAALSGAAAKVGLDTDNRRGAFLDVRVPDPGYLVRHEVTYVRDILAALGIDVAPERLRATIHVDEAARRRVDDLLFPLGGRPFMTLHVGSSKEGWRALKRLPLQVWLDLAARIARDFGTPLVLVGGREDRDANAEFLARAPEHGLAGHPLFDLGDRTTLPELLEVISRSSLFVGTDSGVAHVGGCSRTPLVTVFLFSDSVGFAPLGDRSHVLSRRLVCNPCLYRKGYETCVRRECFGISAEEIFAKVRSVLGSSGGPGPLDTPALPRRPWRSRPDAADRPDRPKTLVRP
ncbi:MAG: glycosyltransferase family 9 protein [Deltaproteobacteria bacterium]|nr:glycosyltransferase family 9 protein [Deltaproteobacteria bacterium]